MSDKCPECGNRYCGVDPKCWDCYERESPLSSSSSSKREDTMSDIDKQMNRSLFYLAIFIFVLFCVAIGGCNTMAGIGKDIHSAAKGIQDRMSESDDPYVTVGR